MANVVYGWNLAGTQIGTATVSDAIAAADPGDTIQLYFGGPDQDLIIYESLTITKRVNFENMILDDGYLLQTRNWDFEFQNSGDTTIKGLGFNATVDLAAGSSGNIIFDRCLIRSWSCSAVNGATAICKSCNTQPNTTTTFSNATGTVSDAVLYNCTLQTGAYLSCTTHNCLLIGVQNLGSDGYSGCTGSYSAGPRGARGSNEIVVKPSAMGLHLTTTTGAYRLRADSALIGVGATGAEFPTVDFYGNTFTPGTIGCDAGTLLENDPTNILVSAGGTFDEAARNTDPGVGNVRDATTYKIQNVDYEGTLDVGTVPSTPTLSASINGEVVTFTVLGADVGTTNTIYTMRRNASTWTDSGSRSGAGTVAVTLSSDYYWAYCESVSAGQSTSTVISLQTTSDSHTITPEEIIRQRLIASGDVAAVVGEKVFPQAAPQSSALPYIIINGINGDHNQHMEAASGILEASVQVDFYAKRLANAKKLANAARLALDGFSGTVSGLKVHWVHLESDADGFDMPDDGSDEYIRRVTHTYSVWVDESVPTF